VNAARGYYETAFRRYTRALGVIKARKVEKTELLGLTVGAVGKEGYKAVYERLKYSNVDIDGEGGAILAYMADDKELVSLPKHQGELRLIIDFTGRSYFSIHQLGSTR